MDIKIMDLGQLKYLPQGDNSGGIFLHALVLTNR